tara:strand:- start:179 stop:616 length:438 start_codon:yes stop_codon:yes gene_type:complete
MSIDNKCIESEISEAELALDSVVSANESKQRDMPGYEAFKEEEAEEAGGSVSLSPAEKRKIRAQKSMEFRKKHQAKVKKGMRLIMKKRGFKNAHQFETACGLGSKTITSILESGNVSLFTMEMIGIGLDYTINPAKQVLKDFEGK